MSAQIVMAALDRAKEFILYCGIAEDLEAHKSAVEAFKAISHKAALWDDLMAAKAVTSKAPDDSEWKRLARSKKIIPAIRECRAAYGLSLREAKDCVESYLQSAQP